MGVENGGICPITEGPTLKLSSQGKPMSRQNSFTLAHWSPFWDWCFRMCVASSSTLNWAWVYHMITILNKASYIESGDRAHELSCLFASCRQFDKLIICIPIRPTRLGINCIWVSHTWDRLMSLRIGLGLKLKAVSKGCIYLLWVSSHLEPLNYLINNELGMIF